MGGQRSNCIRSTPRLTGLPDRRRRVGRLARSRHSNDADLGACDTPGVSGAIALFRLAHDFAVSGFGSRQMLYERFFFGPPNILASVYFDLYNKDDMMDRVDVLLKATD